MTYELPIDFPHTAPEGYSYSVEEHKRGILSIWLLHSRRYVFHGSDKDVRTIWGYYKSKSREYYAPIDSKKVGKLVNVSDTTPYTSMPLNFSNSLEHALFGST